MRPQITGSFSGSPRTHIRTGARPGHSSNVLGVLDPIPRRCLYSGWFFGLHGENMTPFAVELMRLKSSKSPLDDKANYADGIVGRAVLVRPAADAYWLTVRRQIWRRHEGEDSGVFDGVRLRRLGISAKTRSSTLAVVDQQSFIPSANKQKRRDWVLTQVPFAPLTADCIYRHGNYRKGGTVPG